MVTERMKSDHIYKVLRAVPGHSKLTITVAIAIAAEDTHKILSHTMNTTHTKTHF